ncbi:hypothetical protein I6F15_00540 [Bradyrhizobium sp. BRP14]|nr:hypothetical protein [Bradyrhizobium sp. BRP14]
MTVHIRTEEFKPNRTSLPRSLVRRRPFVNAQYAFEFEIGQRVVLLCTNELAMIVGRTQLLDCEDEYVIEILGADCAPLGGVQAHQMIDATPY